MSERLPPHDRHCRHRRRCAARRSADLPAGQPVAGADPDVTTLGPYDVDGSISYIDNFFGIDFIPTDAGLTLLG
jgi:hypothetical protein